MSALSTPGSTTPAAYRGRGRGGARLADLVWLTWRQHRAVIVTGLAVAGVVTGSMLYVAARIATINQECKNTACPPGSAQAASLTGLFGLTNLSIYLTIIVMFLPLLTGVFLGAPLLAREHEQRTLLLAWSQDITPQRWLWTKFAAARRPDRSGGSGGVRRCRAPGPHGEHRDREELVLPVLGDGFLVTGILPLALQTVAWLAVGVALGAAYRRTLPAIFTALTGYSAVLFLVVWRVSVLHGAADSPGPPQRQPGLHLPAGRQHPGRPTRAWTRSTTRPATP